jgi:peptidyl-prolyl cis-trans isomerase SurA
MQDNNQTNDTSNTPPDTGNDVPNLNNTPVETSTPELSSESTELPVEVTSTTTVVTPEHTTAPVAVPVVESPVVATPEAVAVAPVAVDKKQVFIQYGVATAVVLVIGVGLLYALEQQGRVNTGVFDKISSIVNPMPAAAIVNGTKITQADYDRNIQQLQTAATAQGADVADEAIQSEIKKQAIDVLVNTELLRQAAYADGSDVTAEQVEARYQEIVASLGGTEQLAAKMTELGITEPALRKDIEGEILIQGHLSKAVDVSTISVSEKELTDAYAQISGTAATGVTVPPLAEIKEQLEAQLKTNKEQELVNAYIEKIREGAEIEVLI